MHIITKLLTFLSVPFSPTHIWAGSYLSHVTAGHSRANDEPIDSAGWHQCLQSCPLLNGYWGPHLTFAFRLLLRMRASGLYVYRIPRSQRKKSQATMNLNRSELAVYVLVSLARFLSFPLCFFIFIIHIPNLFIPFIWGGCISLLRPWKRLEEAHTLKAT